MKPMVSAQAEESRKLEWGGRREAASRFQRLVEADRKERS